MLALRRARELRQKLMAFQASEFSVKELWHILDEPREHNADDRWSILEGILDRKNQPEHVKGPPVRRFVLGEEGYWLPLGSDGRTYPSHKHDAEAVLRGMNPGVIIAIYPPDESDL